MKLRRRLGWMLMGIPWWSETTYHRSMQRNNWHARLYFYGSALHQ